jgi:hypothetical protein
MQWSPSPSLQLHPYMLRTAYQNYCQDKDPCHSRTHPCHLASRRPSPYHHPPTTSARHFRESEKKKHIFFRREQQTSTKEGVRWHNLTRRMFKILQMLQHATPTNVSSEYSPIVDHDYDDSM